MKLCSKCIDSFTYDLQLSREVVGGHEFFLESLQSFENTIDQIFERLKDKALESAVYALCPYFGALWPSARALAEILCSLDKQELDGKTFLEVGCGLALPSMLASRLGALVMASDFHPDVELFFSRNIERNSLANVVYRPQSWGELSGNLGTFDIIVGSDVLYESKQPEDLAGFLVRTLKSDGVAVITDPKRPYFKDFVKVMQDSGYTASVQTHLVLDKGDKGNEVKEKEIDSVVLKKIVL